MHGIIAGKNCPGFPSKQCKRRRAITWSGSRIKDKDPDLRTGELTALCILNRTFSNGTLSALPRTAAALEQNVIDKQKVRQARIAIAVHLHVCFRQTSDLHSSRPRSASAQNLLSMLVRRCHRRPGLFT
jgi:hypothetical protein